MRGCVEPGDVQKGEEMERFNKKQGAELVGVRLPPTRIQKTPKRWVPYTERGWRGGGGEGIGGYFLYIYITYMDSSWLPSTRPHLIRTLFLFCK
jgi:hypothetical protein